MINASPVRPLAPTSPSGLPTSPAAPAAVPPAPPQPPAGNASTSSFTPQPKKRFSPKLILGLVVLLLAVIGGVAGLYLTQVNQDVRQQAAYTTDCPQGSTPESPTTCRCAGGIIIPRTPGSSCPVVADHCPAGAVPVTSGSSIGKCRCTHNNVLVDPNGSCNVSCSQSGGVCVTGSTCGAGSSQVADSASQCGTGICCKSQTAQTCPQVGGTCVIGACGGGQQPNSAVCGQSGYVCCMPGSSSNTCEAGLGANIGGGTYQCQGTSSNLRCNDGYTAVTDAGVSCNAPGQKVCCKPAAPATSCPVGSTKVENGPVGGGAGEFTCRCTISGQIVTPGGSCVATNCPAGTTPITSGVNIGKCNCPGGAGVNILPGEQCPGTGGTNPTPNPTGNPACTIKPLDRCTPGATTCCANGGVCQGVAGKEVCQVPTTSPNAQCGTGGTCTGWYGFKCTQLMTNADGNPECLENGQPFGTRSQAVAYAGSCGQVDQVCVGGPKAGQLCGDFSVFNQCGGGGGNPSPSPSTPIGPMCLNITMAVNGSAASATNKPKIGDRVTFTCGQVAGATRYRFRVIEPGGTRVNINGTGRVSQQYGVTVAGGFTAECSACMGADNSTCTDWPSRN